MAPRTTVEIRSRSLMEEAIRLKGMSIRYVAQEVKQRCGRCSPGMISHFLTPRDNPRKKTCSAELGRAIEEVLGLTPGLLFAPAVSTKDGSDDNKTRTAA